MSTGGSVSAREAKYGEKMIEIEVRFWTDSISTEPGKILPKHALTGGVVRIKRNASHGIVPVDAIPFNSLFDIGIAIEKVLKAQGIVLHPTRVMKKYISSS